MLSNRLVKQRSGIQHGVGSVNAKQKSSLELMETSRTPDKRVVRLGNASSLVGRLSLTKEGFVTASLDVCSLACIDFLPTTQVERIRNEISEGYGGQGLPSQVSSKLAEREGKIQEMKMPPPGA